MNRHQFLSILIGELRSIDPSELQDILQYYNEYFDDAGVENEANVIAELGDPKLLGAKLRASSAVRSLEENSAKSRGSAKAVWVAIVSIFAAPIALPIALALALVAFSIIIVIASLFFSLFVIGISLGVSAIFGLLAGFIALFELPSASITFFGMSIMLAGLCMLIVIPTIKLTTSFFKNLALLINKIILKKHGDNQNKQSKYNGNQNSQPSNNAAPYYYPYPPAYAPPTPPPTNTKPFPIPNPVQAINESSEANTSNVVELKQLDADAISTAVENDKSI